MDWDREFESLHVPIPIVELPGNRAKAAERRFAQKFAVLSGDLLKRSAQV
jgi:hypothetical protein